MTYHAKMQNGKVIFEGGIKPADGLELRVDVLEKPQEEPNAPPPTKPTLSDVLLKFAGVIDDPSLPEDGSLNVDHYIYGTPKR